LFPSDHYIPSYADPLFFPYYANLFVYVGEVGSILYRTKAARPARPAIPAKAVWRAPPAVEVEVPAPVAEDAAPDARVERLDATDARELETLEPTEERLLNPEVMEDPTDEAAEPAELVMEEAAEPADPVAPPTTPPTPKRVVEPTVVSKVELPEVTVETIADVVTADEDPV